MGSGFISEGTNLSNFKIGSLSNSQHKKILSHLSSKHGYKL